MAILGSILLLVSIFAVIYHIAHIALQSSKDKFKTIPSLTRHFVCNEKDIDGLIKKFEFSIDAPRIVGITGPPGFGKSTLALSIGHKMIAKGIDVIYIDASTMTGQHQLAEEIIKGSTFSKKISSLIQWSINLDEKTLLIFDNCDKHFHTNEIDLRGIIDELVQKSDYKALKVLTTSRYHVGYTEKLFSYGIKDLSPSLSCTLLQDITDSLNSSTCLAIANLTGNAPIALKIVASLLNMPDPPQAQEIISQLEENLIATLSPDDLTGSTLNVSIYLSYQYLDNATQKIGRLLSFFPGLIDRSVRAEIISKHGRTTQNTLLVLVKRSLLAHNSKSGCYVYHQLIREFFKGMSTTEEVEEFYTHFLDYYAAALKKIETEQKYFIDIVPKFDGDEQNFKHFFDKLAVNIKGTISSKKEIQRFKRVTDIVDKFRTTALRPSNTQISEIVSKESDGASNFTNIDPQSGLASKELLHHVIKSHLLNMKKINEQLIEIYELDWFVSVYSKLVIHWLAIEEFLNNDAATLVKHMHKHEWIFEEHGQIISHKFYNDFFLSFSNYYNQLKNYTMARNYREKIEHGRSYTFLELAIYFLAIEDFEASVVYCDKELESIKHFQLSRGFKDAIQKIEMLIKLHKTLTEINTHTSKAEERLTSVTMMLSDITKSRILAAEPQNLVDYAKFVVYLIDMLQIHDKSLQEKLKVQFVYGIKTCKSKQAPIFELMYSLYREKKYEMVIFVRESISRVRHEERLKL